MILFLFIAVLSFFFVAEILYKRGVSAFWTRKIVHIGAGSIISVFPYFLSFKITIFLGISTTIFIIFLRNNGLLKSVFNLKEESVGARIFVPALMLLAVLSWNHPIYFTVSALILSWADGLSGLIGQKFGRKKIYNKKTYLGSLTFFVISFLIMIVFLSDIFSFWILFFISFLVTFVESVSLKGWDNLFIPLSVISMIYFFLW